MLKRYPSPQAGRDEKGRGGALTDLVAYTYKKYLELDTPRSATWPPEARAFVTQCKQAIWSQVKRKRLSFRELRVPTAAVDFAKAVRAPLRRAPRKVRHEAGEDLA